MICPDCGHTFTREGYTRAGFWQTVQAHALYHISHQDKYNTVPSVVPPPVRSHSIAVRGRLPDSNHSFTLDYRDVSSEAAVEAAKRDARHIFGTDTDAKVIIDQIYVSN